MGGPFIINYTLGCFCYSAARLIMFFGKYFSSTTLLVVRMIVCICGPVLWFGLAEHGE